MGKEHKGIKSIYRDYEDWEINTLEPHEPWKASNRTTSIKLGMFMYINRDYHAWLHETEEGQEQDKIHKAEMTQKCLEHYNMSEKDFEEIFIKGNRIVRDKYIRR